jgi:hypothetical protein
MILIIKKYLSKMNKPLTNAKLFDRMMGCIPEGSENDNLRKKLSIWNGLADHVLLDELARESIYEKILNDFIEPPAKEWEIELIQLFIGDWIAYNSTITKELRNKFMKLEKIKMGLV